MAEAQKRVDELIARLRASGHRATPQRVAVLRLLVTSDRHPSVERVYEQMRAQFPTTSLSTVYKTVTLLKEMGEVLELGFADGSSRYDGNRPYPHPHLVCTRCGGICDLTAPGLEDAVQRVVVEVAHQIVGHRLDFYTVCADCQSSRPPAAD